MSRKDGENMQKYAMALQYRGTEFAGWQTQKNRPTVQALLQSALAGITGETRPVVGAGRTDSGTHALGQVAHFVLNRALPVEKLWRSLNGVLPPDIRVLRVYLVPPDFHAQRLAIRKRYQYRIFNGPVLSPFLNGLVLQVREPLDEGAMDEAARILEGTMDFTSFAAASSSAKSPVRTVYISRVKKRGRQIHYSVEGNGFLHHMVRNIVGTLLEIGRGKRPVDDMMKLLQQKDRRLAGPTAPAHGLYLVRVWYPDRSRRAARRTPGSRDV